MALLLANAGPSPAARQRQRVIASGIRGVAELLGDTPAVTRKSYADPRLISRYEADGRLPSVPVRSAALPVPEAAEQAVAHLLADG